MSFFLFQTLFSSKNIVDDPNILSILSQHPTIDVILTKSSFHLLLELFATKKCSSAVAMPLSIREFQFETLDNPKEMKRKKVIFIDKSFRQKTYTKRELNRKFYQRSFRSLLLSTTGGKREVTDNPFSYSTLNNKTDFQITEIRNKIEEKIVEEPKPTENICETEDDEEEDEGGMIISTDGDNEEQQKLFHKSKQKIIHSAPIIQEWETNNQQENISTGPGLIVLKTNHLI